MSTARQVLNDELQEQTEKLKMLESEYAEMKKTGEADECDPIAHVYTDDLAAHIAAFDPPTVLALIAKLREAEAVIAEALNHDPLHGSKEGMHCGGMAPCIRETLTAHEPWNYEK